MNVIGEKVKIMGATDPSKKGIIGEVVLETAKTLLVQSGSSVRMVEKSGTVLLLQRTNVLVTGEDFSGRLEDRFRTGRQ